MVRMWIDNHKSAEEKYFKDNPDSLIPLFLEELRSLGMEFETSAQAVGCLPKHKKEILPVAMKYYELSKKYKKPGEQDYFISFFHSKGLDDILPILLEDYCDEKTADLTRWYLSDCIYEIRSGKYVKEYIDIVSNKTFGINRQMIILLLGKLKEESAVPVLVRLLEDEEVRLHAICALGEFKREDFRCYFERFQDSTNPGCRKYAKAALKKLR